MRYFETAQPSAWHILTDADLNDAAGEPRRGRLRDQWSFGVRKQWESVRPALQFCRAQDLPNRPSRRQHLSPRRSQ